ncbi:hypothetical protein P152DRAFT_488718 [Eremomyces bilateralis CBS 781.70]|uniref:Uncharacterized protein n=1 Tax=Eremomyces bilateralis CBS 781.70 TaxID=1392243 RepID=A0A6G1G142_9PEZI|nr:uncharacterized protein P152DRAFT_488718 [Eremomyces bilateralis CBS 781.70]KAF1811702.1 hypothetical protein P152DRAFT_488718 [Eremomyces bilateralis CBS 781.70]
MGLVFKALAPVRYVLNLLLPFTKPATPIWRDILHSVVLCTLLYYGPEISRLWWVEEERREIPDDGRHQEPINVADDTNPVPEAGPGQVEVCQTFYHHLTETDLIRQIPRAPTPPTQPNRFQYVEDDSDADDRPPHPAPDAEDLLPAPVHPLQQIFPHIFPNIAAPDNPMEFPPPPPPPPQPPQRPQRPQPPPPAQRGDRTVGKKKSASLQRKEERRAYNEFMRSQGNAAREAIAAEQAERAGRDAEEKRRREEYVRQTEERQRKEREERMRREREAEEERREVVERAEREVRRRGAVRLVELAARGKKGRDEAWVEGVLKRGGVLGKGNGAVIMITETGWLVRVDEGRMAKFWEAASKEAEVKDKLEMEDMAAVLGRVLVQQSREKG